MIYRIDFQHFLSHMIDHFPRSELVQMQYAIISAKIGNTAKALNVVKCQDLYPTPDMIIAYDEYDDKNVLKKLYYEMLDDVENDKLKKDKRYSNHNHNAIYNIFINPLIHHNDIVIVCDEKENDYIDCLCDYLKDRFEIEVIDLNTLFKKGKVGSIYIDRDAIYDKAVDIRRAASREAYEQKMSTVDGKICIIKEMSKKEKVKMLKKDYGIKLNDREMKDIDSILLEAWIDDEKEKRGIYD